jgi:hypothetical protein
MNNVTLRQQRTERLEALILEGMNSPMSPLEPDWAEKAKAQLRERIAAKAKAEPENKVAKSECKKSLLSQPAPLKT